MNALLNWIDDRTNLRALMHEALYERIPGGARWRYVWGSTLVFAFAVQAITGLFLWMAYSPSGQTAWESVYYIQYQMYGGWLLRGLHHFMAQAMVVLLALHVMQVVIDGAYRAPREFNFWTGLILLKVTLGLSLTGYLLPWDQKGYWATRVATNLAGIVPVVGPYLQKVVVGGSDYGHHTLTRFFALHAGLLPAALVGVLVLHLALFRKHGIHTLPSKKPDVYFWPDQVLKDAVACLAVLCVVLFFIFKPVLLDGASVGDVPGAVLGAHLDAPADRANEYSAARPEWYFLFLFQFLKYFEGYGAAGELWGAIILPGMVMGVLFLMPLIGRWNLGHRFNIGLISILLLGVVYLTGEAWWDDNQAQYSAAPAPAAGGHDHATEKYKASQAYLAAVKEASENAHRSLELASGPQGIPASGMLTVLNDDPKMQGPRLFKRYCASCHSHVDASGAGIVAQPSSAPNLYRFADRKWIGALLSQGDGKTLPIDSDVFFGLTEKHKDGEMAGFIRDTLSGAEKADVELATIALSAEAALPSQKALDAQDAAKIAEGQKKIVSLGCTDCHKYKDAEGSTGYPDLTGYGSAEWLKGMISNPAHERFYGENNERMPAFVNAENPASSTLNPKQLDLLVRWLRGEWYEPHAAGH